VQDSTSTFRLTGPLNDSAARSITKSGSGAVEISGPPTLGAGTTISASAGTLRFAMTGGSAIVGAGVQVNVTGAATLELAGTFSALSSGVYRANVVNSSTAAAGLVVSGTNQQIGGIDGSGTTQVNAGSDLTANHIIQSALIIGGTGASPALVTIAASDASGNPLRQSVSFATNGSMEVDGTLTANAAHAASLSFGGGLGEDSPIAIGTNSTAVPEPSAWLLLAIAAALSIGRCRTKGF
jgi:autotransporter-associated beta strand protein